MMKIGNIKQIIIYVEDMDTQVKFYSNIFGFAVIIPVNQSSYTNDIWVQLETGEASLCLHAGGKKDFGSDSPKYTFEVENIKEAKEYLEEKNVKHDEIRSPTSDHYVIDAYDPEGNKFSLEQFG